MLWTDSLKGLWESRPHLSPHPAPLLSPPQPSDASRYFSGFIPGTTQAQNFPFTHYFIQYLAFVFQVTTNSEARVGRFSVSRAPEQIPEPSQTPQPAVQAANGPSNAGQLLSPDSAHKASLPSLNNNSFNNSYISSDNDSEFEDEDFKREVSRLREKQVCPFSLLENLRGNTVLLPRKHFLY